MIIATPPPRRRPLSKPPRALWPLTVTGTMAALSMLIGVVLVVFAIWAS